MSFEDFQDGRLVGHLRYRNGMILAILNLHVALMPTTKFGLCLNYGSRADMVSKFSRWPPRWPSWIAKWNASSNFESQCLSDDSHYVSAQSNLWFVNRCGLKNFNIAAVATILDIRTERF